MKRPLIESVCFHNFIDDHDWHDVDVQVSLPGRDRTYLLTQLGADKPNLSSYSFPVETDDGVEEADIKPHHETGYPPEESGVSDSATASTMDDHHEDPLTEEQKRVIHKIYVNCGHPSKDEFMRALRLSRARPKVLHYVRKYYNCPACEARGKVPRPRRPASLPRTFRFNETVGINLF